MNGRGNNLVAAQFERLTRRETEVLALLADGHSAPEIAEKLTLALSSVKWYVQQVYGKLGVNSKRQAIKRAQALGWLSTAADAARELVSATPPHPPIPQHNLPLQITRFFGRELEVTQLTDRVLEHRLVTITGSGGVGKTRLSLQVAEAVRGRFLDGVWLVELGSLSEGRLVAQQVAGCLGLRDEPGRTIVESLTQYLVSRQVMVVLDNCEHLLQACAQLADVLLRACPRVKLLASSREPLGIIGEAVFVVPSLPFPDTGLRLSAERLDEYPAVRLFADRARLVLPAFHVAPHNAAWVAHICQRLDGIPLAIEMAAARANVLTAEQLAARLDDTFRVLTSGSRTALPHQQTLRATMEWSYHLLREDERLLLQRLSVFSGGCTLAAAEAVCCGEGLEVDLVLERLASLVGKSMVRATPLQGQAPRYHLLEMMRLFAGEKLKAAGASERMFRRHRDHFLALAESAHDKYSSRERPVWSEKLIAERGNLRAALEWSFSDPNDFTDVDAGPRLTTYLLSCETLTHHEAADWCQRAVAWCQNHPQVSDLVYAPLLALSSNAIGGKDLRGAVARLQAAVEFSRRLGPAGKTILMENLMTLSDRLASLQELDQSLRGYAEAEVIFHELGPETFQPEKHLAIRAQFAAARARLANKQGRYADAKRHASESIVLSYDSGDLSGAFGGHVETGDACLALGEFEQAHDQFLAALDLLRMLPLEPGNFGLAYLKRCLGLVDLRWGKLDRAQEYCQASLREAVQGRHPDIAASGLALAAGICANQGQAVRAATLSGAAQGLYGGQGRPPWEEARLDTLLLDWRERPEQAAISQALAQGMAMNFEQAVDYALEVLSS